VVVGTAVQSGHPVVHAVARGQDQDGKRVGGSAQLAENVQAALTRQIEIQQKQIVMLTHDGLDRLPAVLQPVHSITLLSQELLQGAAKGGIVFDHENSHDAILVESDGSRRSLHASFRQASRWCPVSRARSGRRPGLSQALAPAVSRSGAVSGRLVAPWL